MHRNSLGYWKRKVAWKPSPPLVMSMIACVAASRKMRGILLGQLEKLWRYAESRRSALARNSAKGGFLALQPIFTRDREIVAYEVLSRTGWRNEFLGDVDTATQTLIDDRMLSGLEEITGGARIFLNCNREILINGSLTQLPSSIVLELLETVEPDDEVLCACRVLKNLGHQIALDDFQPSAKMDALIELADCIKVDFRLSNKEMRREILCRLRGRAVELLAEKIESEEELTSALEEGFHLFQGYFLARPMVFRKCTGGAGVRVGSVAGYWSSVDQGRIGASAVMALQGVSEDPRAARGDRML